MHQLQHQEEERLEDLHNFGNEGGRDHGGREREGEERLQ